MELKIVLEKGEDGYIVVHCPSLKGCWSQGKTEKEAISNIKEAIELYLESDVSEKQLREKINSYHKIMQVSL
ncbi:MAG: type II toxin-antitoxin system HicB family antitoxin [Candidatus Omnitrophica bacterium]|nr:type II toxin-antitoxin system HicB family antitoxin [Candidatus Omnitrophota bacterium]